MDKNEATLELLNRFTYADNWRQQYDEQAIEWYKLYVGYREHTAERIGRSNMHIPRAYEEIDALRSRLVKSIFSSRPYIDFVPMPNNINDATLKDELTNKAIVAASLVDMQLEKNNFIKKIYDFITSMLIYPAGIMGVGWRLEHREISNTKGFDKWIDIVNKKGEVERQDVIVWDDNELVNIDYFDFWPDPRGSDIDSCRFVFQREWLTEQQIKDQLELLKSIDSGTVYMPDFDKLKGSGVGIEEGRWERLSAVGIAPETEMGYNSKESGYMYEVLHYWEDARHAMLINRSELVYDGDNPYYRHGKKPFIVSSFEPLPNEFYGMSAMQILQDLQHELNTLRNQRIDNISFALNKMWKVLRSADIDESELVSRPHGIIHVDTKDDVTEFQMNDITASAYNDEKVLKEDMENALGVPAVIRGASTTKRETATEVVTKSSNAGIRFDVKIMLFDALGIKRLAYLMDCNNQQFIDGPRIIRLYGIDNADLWQQITPDDIIGEYDYRPAGSSVDPSANKEVRRQQLLELLTLAIQTQNPYINQYELTKMVLETYDIRNPEKILQQPNPANGLMDMLGQQPQPNAQTQPIPNQQPPPEGQPPQAVNAIMGALLGGR